MKKNALITGGLGGIGQAIVTALLGRGDHVIIFDCLPPDHELALRASAHGCHYIYVDLASVVSIQEGFASLDKHLSSLTSPHLNILVNNAGVTRDTLALRMKESDWDSVIDVNLKGSFFCAQQALKRMIKNPVSYIINIASIVGIRGNAGQSNYVASKAGLIGLTKTLAIEYAVRNVLVNAVAPGFIKTPMTDRLPDDSKTKILQHIALGRFGSPCDVANVVEFLSSGKADYITGQVIEVAGGL